ncbi:unnamed protein product [Ceutorhynchus assimilis]|uniref:DUF4806 domain-containing protein n=1 Tax=Ceutorhynchus assimilis TaxID=467358 RepID=A0A9N9MPC7_9CUCU|nr:unnamed protein product [Ceutorhynchus assimilis]
MENLYRNQLKINADLNNKLEYIATILEGAKLEANTSPAGFTEPVDLPVKTLQDLQDLETKLADDKEYKNYLHFLKRIGGRNCVETTRRIISILIGHNLALQCNWTGRNSKTAFNINKALIKLITEAVISNPACGSEATASLIEGTMKAWLRGACDRDGGRVNRKK